jgi:REP element-mobilizing transposase RayT
MNRYLLQDMRYRRALIKGATYFFRVDLAERWSRLLVDRVDELREVVRDALHSCHLPRYLPWCCSL